MEAVELSASSPRLESVSLSTCLSSQYAAGRMPVCASVPVSGEGDLGLDVDVAGAGEVSLGDDAFCCCSLMLTTLAENKLLGRRCGEELETARREPEIRDKKRNVTRWTGQSQRFPTVTGWGTRTNRVGVAALMLEG